MAVRLTLDDAQSRDDPAARRGRRSPSHARPTADQACLDAVAALLRGDTAAANRCLARLDPQLLRSRLLPALQEFARTAEVLLAGSQRAADGAAVPAGAQSRSAAERGRRSRRAGRASRLGDGPDSAA